MSDDRIVTRAAIRRGRGQHAAHHQLEIVDVAVHMLAEIGLSA